ncbi:hypothetical protein ZIOFF_017844 [Zingiber officinale]|uniref:START domain-containing protein n=2 Tax=Zingiber officinale TaxID=94328 RepID=A0A8J5LLN0_ZINOF|nr:hypothetical protein ZIOFF_017844 [Zingiber officinale]
MEHEDNLRLKEENTQLLTENVKLKGALRTIRCSNCGQPPTLDEKSIDELILENAGMREKIEMVMGLIAKYTSRPLRTPSVLLEPPVAELNLILSRKGPETEKTAAHLLAVVAMEELLAMAQREAPLWIPGIAGLGEALNEEEYARAFPGGLGPRFAGLGIEASRATAIIAMDAVRLVDILMDVSKWSAFFSSIVAGATYITGYSFGTGESYDGSLQLITAELQAPSPLVALREGLFLRHCKLHGEGLWAVVDVSFEVSPDATMTKFRRRPSGCIIQQLPDDRSKVIWIEHVEVEAGGIHDMYKPIVNSGLVFGAKRWLETLSKQCERMASLMASNSTAPIVGDDAVATKNILKLSDRMVVCFFSGVSGSVLHQWADRRNVGMNDVKIRGRKNNGDPGRPTGIVLSASTSIWLPIPPKRIFDFLRDVPSRNQWDVLLHGSMLRETASIDNGQDEKGNCISIFSVGMPEEGRKTMMLQEICFGPICSFVIYTPIDSVIINAVIGGADPNFVALLPSGFVIHPDGPSGFGDDEAKPGGSILTVAFQISMHSRPNSKISAISIATVNNLLSCTCARIRAIALAQ